jgi:tellurite resistance protein
MSVNDSTQWVIVACGLIAHADGVLEGSECDRLLSMIDDELEAGDYSDWLALIGDRDALAAKLDALSLPPEAEHREVLERAWAMAMVDGDRCEAEVAVLYELAARLGVEQVQVDFWREAWTTAERGFSASAAESAVVVLGGGRALVDGDRDAYEDMLERLPTGTDHRAQLGRLSTGAALGVAACGQNLAALPRRRRIDLLRVVAALVQDADDRDGAHERFLRLAAAAGVSDKDARRLIAAARPGLV